MRFDLPHDLPHSRRPEPDPPLEPSPVERLRASLDERAGENRGPESPQPRHTHSLPVNKLREVRERAVLPELHVDHRPRRESLPRQAVDLALRAEEQKVLTEIGRFRVIATRDLDAAVYDGRTSRMERDLAFLREKGLITVNAVNARRDGRGGKVQHLEVVTLTKAGRDLARQSADLPQNQKLYVGLVKPREVEHDSQIYRAYLKESERIKHAGGKNLRVQLDFELKAEIQKAIYAERKADPARDLSNIKQQVAHDLDLPFVNAGIQIPDARILYDLDREGDRNMDQGSRTGHEDIEVLTAAYRPGHLRNKAQAGFHMYASASDHATLTAKAEGDHHMLDNILEL